MYVFMYFSKVCGLIRLICCIKKTERKIYTNRWEKIY